jgi:hypothetical protein
MWSLTLKEKHKFQVRVGKVKENTEALKHEGCFVTGNIVIYTVAFYCCWDGQTKDFTVDRICSSNGGKYEIL